MLKEKLYLDYQQRCQGYQQNTQALERLEQDMASLQEESLRRKRELEQEKQARLEELSNKKKSLKEQLSSVQRDQVNSPVYQEFVAATLAKYGKAGSQVASLEAEKESSQKKLKLEQKQAVKNLEEQKKNCQEKLNRLMDSGANIGPKQFQEQQLRQRLEREKEAELEKCSAEYDETIGRLQNELDTIDDQYAEILNRELSYLEDESRLQQIKADLTARAESNALPQVLQNVLEKPVEKVVDRNHLMSGTHVLELAKRVVPLNNLSQYTPKWLHQLVMVGLPLIVGIGILLIFMASGVRFGAVSTATNVVVNFVFRLVCAAIGFGILYGILGAVAGTVPGVLGGIVGAVGGFMLAMKWFLILPYGVTNTVEWVVKLLLCAAVALGVRLLNKRTPLGGKLIALGMQLQPVQKLVLQQQGYDIRERVDSYYVLSRFSEVVTFIAQRNKQQQQDSWSSELSKKQQEKEQTLRDLAVQLDKKIEKRVANERSAAEESRRNYEQSQQDLIQMQDACMRELSQYDEKIQEASHSYQQKIVQNNRKYEEKIAQAEQQVQQLSNRLAEQSAKLQEKLIRSIQVCDVESDSTILNHDVAVKVAEDQMQQQSKRIEDEAKQVKDTMAEQLQTLHEIFHRINNNTVGFEEARGVLSDDLYLFNENGSEDPKRYEVIHHEKKPIVFLYQLDDSTNISASLFEFMQAVLTGIYTINARESFEVIITDPVSKARKFEQLAARKLLTIENDIKELSASIQASMREVAKTGKSIDQYNISMYEAAEDKVKYLKYKIVEFIVPEESAAQNTNFFDSDLWGTLGDGKENGFLPIFYINYSDWKNTFDEESKMNSKFIRQLKHAMGRSNGCVYEIDVKNISIKKSDWEDLT